MTTLLVILLLIGLFALSREAEPAYQPFHVKRQSFLQK